MSAKSLDIVENFDRCNNIARDFLTNEGVLVNWIFLSYQRLFWSSMHNLHWQNQFYF